MKNTIFPLLILLVVFASARPTLAVASFGREIKDTINETVQAGKEAELSPVQIRLEMKEEVQKKTRERKDNLIDQVKNFIKKRLRFDARISGEIIALGENTISVKSEDEKTYSLNINSETNLVRRFGGKSELSEFAVGNKVNVFGKFTDEEQSIIDAKLVRNISASKRWSVIFGKVTSKNDESFVMEGVNRPEQTVFIEGAELKNRNEEPILYSEVEVEHRVRVKGMWDRSLNQMTEIDEVKNFSIPTQPLEN